MALGLLPAVEGARPAARKNRTKLIDGGEFYFASILAISGFVPPGKVPGSTAGETPAATNKSSIQQLPNLGGVHILAATSVLWIQKQFPILPAG